MWLVCTEVVAGRRSLNNPILAVVACTWCGVVLCRILDPRWEVEPPPSYICWATFALGEAPPGGGGGPVLRAAGAPADVQWCGVSVGVLTCVPLAW